MNILDFFEPVSELLTPTTNHNKLLFNQIVRHTENNKSVRLSDFDIAIVGVTDDRNSKNKGCAKAPNQVRRKLYELYAPDVPLKVVDLGNLKDGKKVNDMYFAVREIVIMLREAGVVAVIIGGSQDITYGMFMAYDKLKKLSNISLLDARLDLGDAEKDFHSGSFISKIVYTKSKYLLNVSAMGGQSYFISPDEIEMMNTLDFDFYRLGMLKAGLREMEPVLRDTDIMSIDINAVKQADAPACFQPSPNGLFADELCQIARYSGISDRLSCFGLFEINPDFDINHQTSHLAAQALWYFIEGFYSRTGEYPLSAIKGIKKYIVSMTEIDLDIEFLNNPASGRWWMEVPYPKSDDKKVIISCSEQDYKAALQQEIPSRWWKFYQKLR